jgi:hypothetical protein
MARIDVFTVDRQKKYVSAIYNFNIDGSSATEIIPKVNSVLPKGSVIIDVLTETIQPVTSSGTPTLKIQLGGVDISASMAYNTYNAAGENNLPTPTTQKIPAAANIGLLFSSDTITAGAIAITVGYFDSADYQNL